MWNNKTKLREKILRSKELTALEKRYLEELVNASDWIPCGERMPEELDKILFVAYGTAVRHGWYTGLMPNNHNVWRDCEGGIFWDNEVTRWMPMPEPPESR